MILKKLTFRTRTKHNGLEFNEKIYFNQLQLMTSFNFCITHGARIFTIIFMVQVINNDPKGVSLKWVYLTVKFLVNDLVPFFSSTPIVNLTSSFPSKLLLDSNGLFISPSLISRKDSDRIFRFVALGILFECRWSTWNGIGETFLEIRGLGARFGPLRCRMKEKSDFL